MKPLRAGPVSLFTLKMETTRKPIYTHGLLRISLNLSIKGNGA